MGRFLRSRRLFAPALSHTLEDCGRSGGRRNVKEEFRLKELVLDGSFEKQLNYFCFHCFGNPIIVALLSRERKICCGVNAIP